MKRVRKALVAGATAAGSTLVTALVALDALTVETVSGAIGAAVAAGVAAGWTTWRVPNDPAPGARHDR